MAHFIITRETWDINGNVVERTDETGEKFWTADSAETKARVLSRDGNPECVHVVERVSDGNVSPTGVRFAAGLRL